MAFQKKYNFQAEMDYFVDKFLLGIIDRPRKITYEPLKITFYLSSPITLNFPWMYFDGLISHLLLREALGEDFYLLPTKYPFSRALKGIKLPPLPIKEKGDMPCSSISFFDNDEKRLEIMYKRFEERWTGSNRKITRGVGYYRDYMIQHLYFPISKVTFFVKGHKKTLEELCNLIIGLGDNTRLGWGAVRSYDIQSIETDYSFIKDGKAMRPIPLKLLKKTSEKVNMAWKPPYWAADTITTCAPPGASIVMK